jgi:single-strand DNA-binding protein
MASLNKVMLIGNVGREPEMRFTPSGVPTTTFSVATSRNRRGQDGEWIEETDWHNIVTWRELAERLNERLTKGTKVYVEGRIQTRSWEGPDGQKRFRTEVVADDVKVLTPRNQQPGRGGQMNGEDDFGAEPVTTGRGYQGQSKDDAEDLPF